MSGLGLDLGLDMGGGAAAPVVLPSMPSLNNLGGWSARNTGTAGASGTLSLNDLSGNGHPIASTSAANPIALTASDPVCGGSPTVHATLANNGALANIASFSTPVTIYLVGYVTAVNADILLLGATVARLFVGLSGSAETWTYRLPNSGNQVSDGHGVNTTASVVAFTIPVSAGTFNSFVGQSTPATATGTVGVIPTGQTSVQLLNGGLGGNIAEFWIYSGADSQPTLFANMNILAQRCGLAAITS